MGIGWAGNFEYYILCGRGRANWAVEKGEENMLFNLVRVYRIESDFFAYIV
jgi:hypothetical protein